jgi:hypothetical protein
MHIYIHICIRLLSLSHTRSLLHTHQLSLAHSITHTHTHTQLTHTHTHTFSFPLSRTLSHTTITALPIDQQVDPFNYDVGHDVESVMVCEALLALKQVVNDVCVSVCVCV